MQGKAQKRQTSLVFSL